jgi:vacuolar protein sorting-associated protein 35
LCRYAAGYSARLLKKPDQCVAVAACSHLFWGPTGVDGAARDADSVVVCLKKSLKIASAAQQAASTTGTGAGAALSLFITVLNEYLFFFDQGCPSVTLVVLQGLLEVINNELASGEVQVPPDVEAYYSATLRHIRHQKAKGGEAGARYEGLAV